MSVEKICLACQVSFTVPNRRHEEVKFCSRACKTSAGWETLKCPCCAVEFKRKKSIGAKSEVKFCSQACSLASRKGRKHRADPDAVKYFRVCEVCSKEFQVTKTRKDTARFCSRECKGSSPEYRAHASASQKGEKSWRWSGGEYLNHGGYIMKKIDGVGRPLEHRHVIFLAMIIKAPTHPFIVTVGGEKKLSSDIEVHHIDRDRANNSLDNLLAVTKFAHAQIHHRNRKPEPWECWPSNPERW